MNDGENMDINAAISLLPGIGSKREQCYAAYGIVTIRDLLKYFPRDYINLNRKYTISECPTEEYVAVKAIITKKIPTVRIKNRLNITKAIIEDETGTAVLSVFNIPNFFNSYEIGKDYVIYGKAKNFGGKLSFQNPRIFDAETVLGYVAVYPAIAGITAERLSENIRTALSSVNIEDFLPENILDVYNLVDLQSAITNIHTPLSEEKLEEAKTRLAFDELFLFRLTLAQVKQQYSDIPGISMSKQADVMEHFYNLLPFEMTNSQKHSVSEIIDDMCGHSPMNRMLCGDVGSGKTAVAAAACVFAYANGWQSALMAPTEILARQHFSTLEKLLTPLGIKVACLVGALTAKESRNIREKIASGEINVVVGTHALISNSSEFAKLALVITDEQHRFGVRQREKLAEKGDHPHRLIMSATPIPRTMAMMMYGDMDISYLTELPQGRKVIKTFAVTDKLRERAYNFIKEQLRAGHQGYIVCARIGENDDDYNAVESYAENLRNGAFSEYNVGLLHGRLQAEQTAAVMNDFLAGNINILVTTTVIEVGVDVPNATVILIEDAELFGLSQLHQLRGRVGRGDAQSYCILVTGNATPEVRERLKMLASTSSGVDIAKYDLERRGAGDFLGVRQSGFADFHFSDRFDLEMMERVDNAVSQIMEISPDLSAYPKLKNMLDKPTA
jgi:ATP-dependent DNA helicase RecG